MTGAVLAMIGFPIALLLLIICGFAFIAIQETTKK